MDILELFFYGTFESHPTSFVSELLTRMSNRVRVFKTTRQKYHFFKKKILDAIY